MFALEDDNFSVFFARVDSFDTEQLHFFNTTQPTRAPLMPHTHTHALYIHTLIQLQYIYAPGLLNFYVC